ncbi:MAG TPA: BrnT family toxin [Thermoanaerobaculia bacterium]|nr:BrnT family toxin [Thermoanaerobaculia bacterium]
MNFQWDARKAALNWRNHRVSFEEAITAFEDPLARVFDDTAHSDEESREVLVGYSSGTRLLLVSFTERDDFVRLISARAATSREQRNHEENI